MLKLSYASITCKVCELQSSEKSQGLNEKQQITALGGNLQLLLLGWTAGRSASGYERETLILEFRALVLLYMR